MAFRRFLSCWVTALVLCGCRGTTRAGNAPPGAIVRGARQGVEYEHGVDVSGYVSDRYTWWDATGQPRVAELVRNDVQDPHGHHGGYLRAFSYVADGATRAFGPPRYEYFNGWGYTVNHYGSGSAAAVSRTVMGTYRTVFAGTYHTVHEFKHRVWPNGGPVDITVHWVFATGRSNPLYAITHDASAAGPEAVNADARAPYGNLNFDAANGRVAGLEWGDRYRFVLTTAPPLTMNSTWDYAQPNTIPYAMMWSMAADAEMGEVQTQTFDQHPAGSDYGPGQTAACGGRTSSSPGSCSLWTGGKMIGNWLWPFQLNNWELPFDGSPTTSKRMAWGQTLGSVGQRSFTAWGRTLSGYPYLSYSVFLVLGKHSEQPTRAQAADIEAAQGTLVTASTGSVVTAGPGGVGRSDPVAFAPPGWDHVYAAWTFRAAANRVAVAFTVPHGAALTAPLVRVLGWTGSKGPTHVRLGDEDLVEGTDWYPSVDPSTGALWLTVQRQLTGIVSLSIW